MFQVAITSFTTYIYVANGRLDAEKAFTCVSLISILGFTTNILPDMMSSYIKVIPLGLQPTMADVNQYKKIVSMRRHGALEEANN